jgi:two-component system cell cycle response regulator
MSAKILVVDDNRTNLELMLYLLRAFGHDPSGAWDGEAGWRALKEGRYDLVLCDVLMPGIDGFEFAQRLRADPQLRFQRLVAVTALAMVGDRDRVLAAGFDGYVAKPIDPQTFVEEVDGYLPEELRSKARSEEESPECTKAERSETAAGAPVILAVDDIQLNLDVIRGALEPFGFRIIEARNCHEALVRARETKPSLILCDVHMPGGGGFEFAERAKSDPELQEIPFLFITSTAWHSSDRRRGLDLGAEKFLMRPIDPSALISEIESSMRKKHGKDPDC